VQSKVSVILIDCFGPDTLIDFRRKREVLHHAHEKAFKITFLAILQLPKTLILFITKLCDIPYPIYYLTKNSKPYL